MAVVFYVIGERKFSLDSVLCNFQYLWGVKHEHHRFTRLTLNIHVCLSVRCSVPRYNVIDVNEFAVIRALPFVSNLL